MTKKQSTQATKNAKNGANLDATQSDEPQDNKSLDNLNKVSSSDWDSVQSALVNAYDVTAEERQSMRNWKTRNQVQWTMANKKRAIAVYRGHDKLTERANSNYLNKGFQFVRVYHIVLREHANKRNNGITTDDIYIKSTVLATVGYDSNSESFVLLSNVKLTVKTRTAQGSEIDKLDRATHCVVKAIKCASEHGVYDTDTMHKVNSLAPTSKVKTVPSIPATNADITDSDIL